MPSALSHSVVTLGYPCRVRSKCLQGGGVVVLGMGVATTRTRTTESVHLPRQATGMNPPATATGKSADSDTPAFTWSPKVHADVSLSAILNPLAGVIGTPDRTLLAGWSDVVESQTTQPSHQKPYRITRNRAECARQGWAQAVQPDYRNVVQLRSAAPAPTGVLTVQAQLVEYRSQ